MATNTIVELAKKQIEFARRYTLSLIDDLGDDDWYQFAEGGVTHIAWQVGHIAMAEYGLCLFRLRGRQSIDTELMSSSFRKKFSRGSKPDQDRAANPPVQQIRDTLARVHQQVLIELADYTEQQLSEPIDEPYAVYNTKLGALLFCSHHEMLHAGQIGLLRRQLGKQPLR